MDDLTRPPSDYQHSPVLVIGLGNPLLGDDAVGWVVAEQVKRQAESTDLEVEVDCIAVGGISLMERCLGYERVILIDAVFTGQKPPGYCYVLSVDDLPNYGLGHLNSTHDTTLPMALSVGRDLSLPIPQDITIVGVEAEQIFEFSEVLTSAVAAAVPQLVDTVMTLICDSY